jgi:hypothetical protein
LNFLFCFKLYQSQENFEEKIVMKGRERMLFMIVVLPSNPLTASESDCKLTYALKQKLWSSMRGLKALQAVLRVKNAFTPYFAYAPKSGDLSNKLSLFLAEKLVGSIAQDNTIFTICRQKFNNEELCNPSFPTIAIVLGGSQHGVLRINFPVEFLTKCNHINTLLFDILSKIYLSGVASSLTTVPLNVILHPIKNVEDGIFSLHVCTKNNYEYLFTD